jgi:hypothetical protein
MLLTLVIALIVCGALLYLLQFLPIDETIKKVIQVIVIVVLAIYVLKALWPMAGLG